MFSNMQIASLLKSEHFWTLTHFPTNALLSSNIWNIVKNISHQHSDKVSNYWQKPLYMYLILSGQIMLIIYVCVALSHKIMLSMVLKNIANVYKCTCFDAVLICKYIYTIITNLHSHTTCLFIKHTI